jgi:DNA-binding NtrC family response regulator
MFESRVVCTDRESLFCKSRVDRAAGDVGSTDHRLAELDEKLIGESPVMQALKQSILTAASCSSTVLITGESGTGKELIARSLHDLSAPSSPLPCY